MKVTKHVNGNVTVTAEGDSMVEVFDQLASLEETFGDGQCGKCQGSDLTFILRKQSDYDFRELRCNNKQCRAKLIFGRPQQEDTKLYPKRYKTDEKGQAIRDDDNKAIVAGNWGWVKYNPETKKEE